MRYHLQAGTLMLACAGCLMAVAQESTAPAGTDKPVSAPATLFKDDAIARAVRETLAESKTIDKETPRKGTTSAALEARKLRGDKYDEFGRQFTEAQRPGCLRPDALKHEHTEIVTKDWVIGLGGILVLPLWAKAIVTGKCN